MKQLSFPTRLIVGAGAAYELPNVLRDLKLKQPLVVTDRYLVQTGLAQALVEALAVEGLIAAVFDGVVPDPATDVVEACAAAARRGRHDCLVALGGGSPIDTAKAAALLARQSAPMRAFKAPHQVVEDALPVIAIPTTAGTGSEATRFTVITDAQTEEKMLCVGSSFMPVAALVDYELTLTKPRRLTADTGLDSLTHAIEAYVSRLANPVSDALAIGAMGVLAANLPVVCAFPADREARDAMMWGATMAGMAFSNASVALVHGMSRPIGARFHVPHGLSNAMLLPLVTEFSAAAAPLRYARCARAMGLARESDDTDAAVSALISGLQHLCTDLQVPTPKAFGIDERAYFDSLEIMAVQALESGSPNNNPRVPTQTELVELYIRAWD